MDSDNNKDKDIRRIDSTPHARAQDEKRYRLGSVTLKFILRAVLLAMLLKAKNNCLGIPKLGPESVKAMVSPSVYQVKFELGLVGRNTIQASCLLFFLMLPC